MDSFYLISCLFSYIYILFIYIDVYYTDVRATSDDDISILTIHRLISFSVSLRLFSSIRFTRGRQWSCPRVHIYLLSMSTSTPPTKRHPIKWAKYLISKRRPYGLQILKMTLRGFLQPTLLPIACNDPNASWAKRRPLFEIRKPFSKIELLILS